MILYNKKNSRSFMYVNVFREDLKKIYTERIPNNRDGYLYKFNEKISEWEEYKNIAGSYIYYDNNIHYVTENKIMYEGLPTTYTIVDINKYQIVDNKYVLKTVADYINERATLIEKTEQQIRNAKRYYWKSKVAGIYLDIGQEALQNLTNINAQIQTEKKAEDFLKGHTMTKKDNPNLPEADYKLPDLVMLTAQQWQELIVEITDFFRKNKYKKWYVQMVLGPQILKFDIEDEKKMYLVDKINFDEIKIPDEFEQALINQAKENTQKLLG